MPATRLKQIRGLKRPPAKVAPTISGSTINKQNSGTSFGVTVPATANIGDRSIVALVTTASTTVTSSPNIGTPTYDITPDGSGVRIYVWVSTITSGGPGATITFTLSTSNAVVGGCITVANTSGYSVVPNIYRSTNTEVLNDRPPRIPSIQLGPQDLGIAITGTQAAVSTNLNGPLISSLPSGWSINQHDSAQQTALVTARALGFLTATGPHALAEELYDTNQASQNAAIVLGFAPVAPRWSDMEKTPTTLGTLVHVYGSSSGAYVERPEVNWGYNTRTPWSKRLQNAFGTNGVANTGSTNHSMPGSRAADTCAFIYGTATRSTEAVPGNALAVVRAGTWNPATTCKLVVADMVGNDIIALGSGTKALAGARHAVRSLAWLARAGTAILHNNGSVTKVGTWTTPSSDGLMGGQAAQTTVPASTWALAVTGQTVVGVVLTGGDNDASATTGSTYRILVDGVEYATGTTHNQMLQTSWGGGTNYRFVQMVVPVTLPDAGAHTVTVEHTGSSGHVLQVQGALYPKSAANLPVVVLNCLHRNTTAESTYGYTWTTQQAYHQILRDVAAEFTDGRVIVYDPNESGRWDQSSMVVSDFVHQNELGHALYAREIIRALKERVA